MLFEPNEQGLVIGEVEPFTMVGLVAMFLIDQLTDPGP